jgi:hypothetical protein
MSILPTSVGFGPPPTLANARVNPAGRRAANPFGTEAVGTGRTSRAVRGSLVADRDALGRQRTSRNRVHTGVDQTTVATLERAVPVQRKSTVANHDRVVSQIESFDPKLARDVQALLDFLAQQDPEGARVLSESLRVTLGHLEQGAAAPSAPAPAGGQVQITVQQIQVAIEATVVEVRAQANSGVAITAQSVQVTFNAQLVQATAGASDPLILDLDGNGIETTTAFAGHRFDLLGTSQAVQAATATGQDGFLALDRNGNGVIDDGRELFGDQHGATDGFAELARFDANADGVIDAADPVFRQLAVFQDSNRNGLTDFGELVSLTDRRVAAILLDARSANETSNQNRVAATSTFVRADGSTGRIADVLLNYLA